MNSNAVILGSFVGSCAIITWREFNNPDPAWPIPVPPPYRYIGAGVAFGLLALVGDTLNDKVASVLAFGLLVGLAFQTAQKKRAVSGGPAIGGALGGIPGANSGSPAIGGALGGIPRNT